MVAPSASPGDWVGGGVGGERSGPIRIRSAGRADRSYDAGAADSLGNGDGLLHRIAIGTALTALGCRGKANNAGGGDGGGDLHGGEVGQSDIARIVCC
jgi:hypothetical protein